MDTKALRQKILDLAIRGKLVPQDPNDEPAAVLLERIREQKKQMVKEGKLKAKDIKNDTVIFVGEDNFYYRKLLSKKIIALEQSVLYHQTYNSRLHKSSLVSFFLKLITMPKHPFKTCLMVIIIG